MHFTPITLEVKPPYLFKGADVSEAKFSPLPGQKWVHKDSGLVYDWLYFSGESITLCLAGSPEGKVLATVGAVSRLYDPVDRATIPTPGERLANRANGLTYRFAGWKGGMLRLDEAGTTCFLLITVAELVNLFRPEEPKMTETPKSEFTEQDEKELLSAEVAGHLCWEVSEETCRALEKLTLAELRVLAREVETAAAAIRAPLQTRVMELRQAARGKQ